VVAATVAIDEHETRVQTGAGEHEDRLRRMAIRVHRHQHTGDPEHSGEPPVDEQGGRHAIEAREPCEQETEAMERAHERDHAQPDRERR
jgi:hypothetical protein